MALLSKPAERPKWATGADPANIATPPGAKQTEGWVVEKPPLQYFNWFQKWTYLWLLWMENRVDAYSKQYDFIVSSVAGEGTHLSLVALFGDAGFVAGSRVLVVTSEALTANLVLGANDVEIILKPGAVISQGVGNSGTGINITGNNNRIKGGKWSGFGTAAILVDAGVTFGILGEMVFSGNTSNITDNSGNCAIYATN